MRKVPLSLDELLALKNGKKENNNSVSKGVSKPEIRYLTKRGREKLEERNRKTVEKKNELERKLKDQKLTDVQRVRAEKRKYDNEMNNTHGTVFNRDTTYNESRKVTATVNNDYNKGIEYRDNDNVDDSEEYFKPIVETSNKRAEIFDVSRNKSRTKDNKYDKQHWWEKPLEKMTSRDWRIMREDFDIKLKGPNIPNPLRTWKESGLSNTIISRINALRYKEPTPIQRATIPAGVKFRNAIGIAETGSGKTLAYILPILNYLTKVPPLGPYEGPYALVLVPARELANQVDEEFQKFYGSIRFTATSLIGGHRYEENTDAFKNGVEVVIATPGRLIDCINKGIVNLDKCFFLVLDEADRMIDLGFEEQLTTILNQLPQGETNPYYFGGTRKPQRTTMMFTATMPNEIRKIATSYIEDPVTATIGQIGQAIDSVKQIAIKVPDDDHSRLEKLKEILSEEKKYRSQIIIFVNYKKSCEIVGNTLSDMGFRVAIMHGSRSQRQREEAINDLKSGRANILVATDVAGRGIDIPNISLVVNYQMSKGIEEYTHRIGRTGRAGRKGTAITFWNEDSDREVLYDLRRMIGKSHVSYCPKDLAENKYAMWQNGEQR